MNCRRIHLETGFEVIVCGAELPKAPSLTWPATREQLEAAGYRDCLRGKMCGCGTAFYWWTTPSGKWIPLSSVAGSRSLEPHFAVCRNRKLFRRAVDAHRRRFETPGEKPLESGRLFE